MFVLIIVAACASDSGTGSMLARDVVAVVQQDNASQARGVLQIIFQNRSSKPFIFVDLRVYEARFDSLPPTDREVTLPPGDRELLVPLEFGDARCGDVDGDEPGVIEVHTLEGELVRFPIELKGLRFLDGVHRTKCAQNAITDAVEVRLEAPTSVRPGVVRAVLELQRRRADIEVTMTDLSSNLIFVVRPTPP
jgi:hypothetical protein